MIALAAAALAPRRCAVGAARRPATAMSRTPERGARVRSRHHDGRARRSRHDHDRHEVRPAAVRPGWTRRRADGFDVEIGKIIAVELGIAADNIEWKESVSANREPFIQNGEVDIVVATYTINDKRKEVVSFAGPYYMAGQSILVLADNDDIKSEEDLVGQPVCSVTVSTPGREHRRDRRRAGARPTPTRTASSRCAAATVVAVTTDNVILAGLAAQNEGEFKVVGKPFTEEPYGIGVQLDDTEFRMWINDVLEKSYEDGRYEEAWNTTAGTVLPFVDPPAVDRY